MNAPERSPLQARLFVLAVAVAAVGVDALTKWWAASALRTRSVNVLGEFLQLALAENPGAAFGLFRDGGVILGVIALCALVWIFWYAGKIDRAMPLVGLGLIAGGALGNLVDRLFRPPGLLRGDVIDFIRLPSWPTFNFADVFVLTGVAVFVLSLARETSRQDDEHARAD